MRRGAEPDHRAAAVQVVHDRLHLRGGQVWNRVKITIRSAVWSASVPGDVRQAGLDLPRRGSTPNSTVQWKPWCLARMRARAGGPLDLYSWSLAMKTIPLASPGAAGSLVHEGAAATGPAQSRQPRAGESWS